ncbi:ATP synthase f chain, mitochondrial precursor [Fusarium torreyae]|uniref:ATP synthase f chain, mitochondrial n=1 Tax=Fusarium torreyae TaxID=1237075 RepID=A0A9W8VC61_9HYPO|nr:ATP synthase f chain, mitochondrial precursor [Fusarium torreyae]
MSFVTRRALSTLIPPKVRRAPSVMGAAPGAPIDSVANIGSPKNRSLLPRHDEDFLAIRSMLGKSTTLRGFGRLTEFDSPQAIGAAPDAIRMQRVVSFYEKLPRGAAPEVKAKGLLGRYQAKHFGKNPTGKPIVHLIVFLVSIGYLQNYYFHLRHHKNNAH